MFEQFTPLQMFSLVWMLTAKSAVEKLYSDHPVTSKLLSSNEIILIHTKALSRFLTGAIFQVPFDERVRQYEEVIRFIESVTTPMYSS